MISVLYISRGQYAASTKGFIIPSLNFSRYSMMLCSMIECATSFTRLRTCKMFVQPLSIVLLWQPHMYEVESK
uniref:Putative ovule protein n=1 Tax=Solanum chacoense TaxID=4108 RepID=A0A0V0GPB8_SOLCH